PKPGGTQRGYKRCEGQNNGDGDSNQLFALASVRCRTAAKIRSRGCLANKTSLAMIFKLGQAAEKNWNRLRGHDQLPKVYPRYKVQRPNEFVRRKLKPLPPALTRH